MGVGTAGGGGGEVKGGCGRGEPGRPGGIKLGGGGARERRGGRWTTGSKLPPGSSSPASPGILSPVLDVTSWAGRKWTASLQRQISLLDEHALLSIDYRLVYCGFRR